MVPTSGLVFEVKTWVAARRISVDPSLTSTLSVLTLKCAAIDSVSSPDLVRVAARLLAAFEQVAETVEHLLAGPDRVLVAADADHAFFDGLQIGVEG